MTPIKLGSEVRDKITGLKGIAICRHTYIQGCARISVQPPVDKDGKMQETVAFDEPQLEVITEKKISINPEPEKPGGPNKYPDTKRH